MQAASPLGSRPMAELDALLTKLEPELGAVTQPPRALDGGFTNHNYRVGLGGEDYVLRVCGKDTSVLGIDRDNVTFLDDEQCLVTRFVEGAPLGDGELRAEPYVSQAGRMLRTLHDGPPFPAMFNGFTIAPEHLEAMLERGGS